MTVQTPGSYRPGEIIEYTSFAPSGYSAAQVVGYASDSEQTRICPNCDQLAVPAEGAEGGLRRCPRCQACVRFPALDRMVSIRNFGARGKPVGKPHQVRESQVRRIERPQ